MSFDHGGTIYAAAHSLGCRPEEILDLSASINPLGMSTAVRAACLSALEQVQHYPDPSARQLCEAVSEYHGIATDSIVVANGSTNLIHLLPTIQPTSSALLIAPAFSEYQQGLTRHGWQVHHHILSPVNRFHLDIASLADDLYRLQPRLLYLCTPGNPSGALYNSEVVAALLDLIKKTDTLLILDEAFMDFCGEEHSSKRLVVESEQGIVLRSMTKFYALAGLRLGCAFAAPPLAERLRSAQPPWEVNTMAQFAGVAALSDQQYAAESRELIAVERLLLEQRLQCLPGLRLFPSAANYLLVELTGQRSAPQIQERLLNKHRIMIRDCSGFIGLSGNFMRIAVRSGSENRRLVEALQEELF